MIKNAAKRIRSKLGFTLMEVLVVIGIIGITAGIAIPSLISHHKSTELTKRNDYAKAIYMAAQENLNQMRASGELGMLIDAAKGIPAQNIPADLQAQHTALNINKYYYSYSQGAGLTYDLIVPNAVDAGIRNQQVIIEYHPSAGIVYSVFYYEGEDIRELYNVASTNATIRDNTQETLRDRKNLGVGYYCAGSDGLEDQAFKVHYASASISYENDKESIITVTIPMKDKEQNITFFDEYTKYIKGLELDLTVTGENSSSYTVTYVPAQPTGDDATAQYIEFKYDNSTFSVYVEIPMDSLASGGGFTKKTENQDVTNSGNLIFAGDNVTVTADITFYPDQTDDTIVMIESATIAGINPMFHSMTMDPKAAEGAAKPYVLAISNSRHLQNLADIHKDIAKKISTIVFTDPEVSDSQAGGTQENGTQVQPVAAEDLVLDWQTDAAYYSISGGAFRPIAVSEFSDVIIEGNGVEIQNLIINNHVQGNAGLFAELKNAEIKNITLKDPGVSVADAVSVGALIGNAENVKISKCHVTNNSVKDMWISGNTNVGGLVGAAKGDSLEKMVITECSVNGVAIKGRDAFVNRLGGLAGSAENTAFEKCTVSLANILSGTTPDLAGTKHSLGGMVGYAKSAKLTKCTSDEKTMVTSSLGAISDLGGMVGFAEGGSKFVDCTSKARAQGETAADTITIPNNNLGGFVGRSESSSYTNTTVILDYLPQHAADAGGFAGLIKSGEVSNLDITVSEQAVGSATVTRFGGIASMCSNTARLDDVEVMLKAEIKNAVSQAGGAFAVAAENSVISDVRVEVAKLTGATEIAGFVVKTGTGVKIQDSYFWGTADHAAGFVRNNAATIQRCFSHVTTSNGAAFVADNKNDGVTGTVRDCYGWARGSSNDTKASNCFYSYFVSYTKENETDKVTGLTVYENGEKNSIIIDIEALSDPYALTLLNQGTAANAKNAWVKREDYPYPSLESLVHRGDYTMPSTGRHPYALLYVEQYSDDGTGEILVQFNENGNVISVSEKNLNNSGAISGTKYYLCHRTTTALDKKAPDSITWSSFYSVEVNPLYSIYELTNKTYYDSFNLHTYYPLKDANGVYRIRTNEQFAAMAEGGNFVVDRNLEVTSPVDFGGTLASAEGVTISAPNGLVGTLTGTLKGLKVEGLAAPMVKTLAGGTIENCNVTANITDGEYVGVIAGIMTGGKISGCVANGSVSGENAGGVIGYVENGSVKSVTSNVSVNVSVSGDSGMFAGYIKNGEFDNCKSTVAGNLPFARFEVVALENANYSYSQALGQSALLYKRNLQNFTAVTEAPQAVQATVTNCWIKVGDVEKSAVTGDNVHYYAVDLEDIRFEEGESRIAHLQSAEVTYQYLLNLTSGKTDPVVTDYYAVQSGSSVYDRLQVTATYVEEESDGDAVILPAYYKFRFTAVSGNGFNQSVDVLSDALGNYVVNDISSLQVIAISEEKSPLACTADDGIFLLYANGQYLSANGLVSDVSADLQACLWTGDGNGGWFNYKDDSITASSKRNDTAVSFTSLITIQTAGQTITTNAFTAQNVVQHYGYEYLGTVTQVYNP